jgi:predicted DNA-binding transcriptional regulator YafY
LTAEGGSGGGWRLLEEYRTNLTGLNEAEVQALFLAKPPRLLADLGLDKAAEAAVIKLLAAIPATARQGAEEVRQRIHVDVPGWRREEEAIPYLPILQEAVWQERRLRFTYGYEGGGGASSERVADPLGLVAKGSVWYFVAAIEGELRTYRVSRVRSATLLDEPCLRPPAFDLADHWERSTAAFAASFPRYPATVRVAPELLPYLRTVGRYARIEREGPPDSDGWIPLAMIFEGEHNACEYILSFGPQIAVVEPDTLRERVITAAAGILVLYERHGHMPPMGQRGPS